jgi:hypothetical protein
MELALKLPKDARHPDDANIQRETTVVETSFVDLSCERKMTRRGFFPNGEIECRGYPGG